MANRWWDDPEFGGAFRRTPDRPLGWPLRQEFISLARLRALVAARKRARAAEERAEACAAEALRWRQADREAMRAAREALGRVAAGLVDQAHVRGALFYLDARLGEGGVE